jgi:hypothetical protein
VPNDYGGKRAARVPAYWTAQRLGTGERFTCAIQLPTPIASSLLGHWELTEEHFARALPLAQVRAKWAVFHRPGDVVAVYNHSTARLLSQITNQPTSSLVLKSVDFNPQRRYGTLEELVAAEGFAIGPVRHPGRASRRLAGAVALIERLRAFRHSTAS